MRATLAMHMPAATIAPKAKVGPVMLREHVCMSQTTGLAQAISGEVPVTYALGYASRGPMCNSRARKMASRGILHMAATQADAK